MTEPLVRLPPFHKNQRAVAESDARFKVLVAGRRFGKALSLDTPLLTTSGWKTMGTVRVGDHVFGDDGHPTRVVAATEIMHDHDVFEVTFSDGARIVADADHEWYVHSKAYRKRPHRPAQMLFTTRELYEAGVRVNRTDGRIENRFAVPVAAPLVLPEREFAFDPYSLGVWLGDGTSTDTTITLVEPEIVENFAYPMHQLNDKLWSFAGEPRNHHRGLLRSIGVFDNKHIPEEYFSGSFEQRLALLQGLMDTDGHISKGGHAEFTSVNQRLAEDVLRLALTLGIKATLSVGDAMLNGRFISHKYRVKFSTTLPVVRLKYKLARIKPALKSDTGRRFITDIRPVDSVPVRCIQVDNESHLYLAGESLIPTHNSWLARMLCLDLAINHGKTVWWVSPTYNNVMSHWRATLNMVGDLPTQKNVQHKYLEFNYRGKRGSLTFKSGDRPSNLRGDGLDFVVIDEAAFVDEEVWESVIRPALSDKLGSALLISTPNGTGDWFHRAYLRGLNENEPDWAAFHYPTTENAAIPGIRDEVKAAKRDMSDLKFRQEYMAEFVDYAGGVFFGVTEAAIEPLRTSPYPGIFVAGIDLGRTKDFTVVSILEMLGDDTAKQVHVARFTDVGFSVQEDRISRLLDDWNVGLAHMENVSISMPVVEHLIQSGYPINAVTVGAHNKGNIIERLSANMQRGRLTILSGDSYIGAIQLSELQAYEMSKSPSGVIRYGAKKGWHDDTVMGLALANLALKQRNRQLQRQENPFY